MVLAAAGREDNLIADLQTVGIAHFKHRQVQLAQCLDQTETGFLVERQGMARHRLSVVGRNPDRLGFGHQIADRGDQAVLPDHHAAAGPLGAQGIRGKGVGRNIGLQTNHRVQRALQVERIIVRVRPQVGGDLPILIFHASTPSLIRAVLG